MPKKPSRRVKPANATTGRAGQLQTAKAKFSEVFRLARSEGPRQGKEGVVVISDKQYDLLTVKSRQPNSLVRFFRESPLVGIDLDLERDNDAGRDVEL